MDLKNKKVQYAIIGVLAGLIFVFMVLQFVILPSISSWKENSAKAITANKQADEMRAVVQTKEVVQSHLDAAKAALKAMDKNIPVPVLGNYLLGMEEYINKCALETGMSVMAVTDNDVLEISTEYQVFKIYRVRVQAKGGLSGYIRMLRNIQANPLCSVSGVNIMTSDTSPESHDISFMVAWIIWADQEVRSSFFATRKK